MDFLEQYDIKKDIVEKHIDNIFENSNFKSESLMEIMKYGILNGGKRIRPILFMSTYEIFQKDYEKSIPFAVALEMIHSYSLIHDDLPAMDNDSLRRGKPTCHIAFSHYGAILAGDALLNLSFETMLSQADKFDLEIAIRTMKLIAQCSGANGMCAGQMSDMEQSVDTFDKLKKMYSQKTGALLKASIVGGAILGGADTLEIDMLDKFSEYLGLIFQIRDDILDIVSTNEVLGKQINSDDKNNKITFVSEYGVDECERMILKYTNSAIEILNKLNLNTNFLLELTHYIAKRNK